MFHIVMFPWLAVGHMTPFLHLSNKLAERGHRISFILPNKAIPQLQPLNIHPDLINFHPLTIPPTEGLPPGTETASDIPIHLTTHLATAMDMTRPQVEKLISDLRPNFVFYDTAHWVPEVSRNLGIKSICYNVVCAASLAIGVVPARGISRDRQITEEEFAHPPPGYPPCDVILHAHEAGKLMFIALEFGSGMTFYERIIAAMTSCDAIAIRTCTELEGPFCDYLGSQFNKSIFLTGPVLPEPEEAALEERWVKWLEQWGMGSVIFCAFGTQVVLEKNQFQEILLGLELTGYPFLAALKPPTGCTTVEEALPEGFRERVGYKGVVHGGWVQQPLVLNHPSVGCFVNHCGFGSMWESLKSESRIVLVPQLADQILNTRLMAGELKVAVEVERDVNGWVSKESLSKAITTAMDKETEVGGLIKENHAKWKANLVTQGFMRGYIDRFVQNLQGLLA